MLQIDHLNLCITTTGHTGPIVFKNHFIKNAKVVAWKAVEYSAKATVWQLLIGWCV